MPKDYSGKTAIVTGGASGIGAAVVRQLAAGGASVVISDRDVERGQALAQELRAASQEARFIQTDVASSASVAKLVAETVAAYDGLDWLHANAGIQRYGTVTGTTEEQWDEVMDVNLKGVYLACHHGIPAMLERGGGSIVISGSVQSLGAAMQSAAYVTSKHAVLGLTRTIAIDYARQGIRCNLVCPGAIDTPLLRYAATVLSDDPAAAVENWSQMQPYGRMGEPEEVAKVVCFLLSDQASFVSGAAYPVDGALLCPIGGYPREG